MIVFSFLLGLAGCLAIYNATAYDHHPTYFVVRQMVWLGMGTALLVGASRVSVERWCRWAWPLGFCSVFLLVLVLFLGHSVHNMRGWFSFRLPGMSAALPPVLIQPSELAKPLFVVCLATLARDPSSDTAHDWRRFGTWAAAGCLWFVPIFLEPDFGTLGVYVFTFFVIYWLQGGRVSHLAAAGGAALATGLLALALHPYARGRIQGFLRPDEHAGGAGWHIQQFQATLAHGGLTGSHDPLWSQYYLPLGYSDSIFATVGERLGLLGLMLVLGVVAGWLIYGMWLARRQEDARSALIIGGLTAMLGGQALMHVSVTLGILPTTGITFPLLSYGGSSLVSTMLAIGIVLGVAHKGQAGACKVHFRD